jgi:hypothetical protein
VFTYPQEAKKFVHSGAERVLSDSPISFHRAAMSRLAALRSRALSLEKNFSIKLKKALEVRWNQPRMELFSWLLTPEFGCLRN